ncbi:hypothetical protein SLEP1_g9610 [Rubroshorea leprosula]|uniref:Uncharacterized protein n=1 Tax=Rubroshorea leprosula TaxID=152421 RepID=A0AAV5IGQ4_9ROSI|nr:hypothetical protein SLEP1_g9610 [Rubroshorea leprosula]
MAGVQLEKELERRFNEFWNGSYKVRVKVADDRRKSGIEVTRTVKECKPRSRMDRLVQLGQSYAQAVVGICPEIKELPVHDRSVGEEAVQFAQKEAVESCVKEATSNRVAKNIQEQPQDAVIDFTSMKEGFSWLEGSMVAMVRQVSLTEREAVSRIVKLKVDDQLYSVGVAEEEWRSDPDFWLTNDDWETETELESDYSSLQNRNEDYDLILAENGGGNEENFNDENLLEKEGVLNFKSNSAMETDAKECSKTEADDDDECGGPTKATIVDEDGTTSVQLLENKSFTGRRRKQIGESYSQKMVEIEDNRTSWVTTRSKQRQKRWKQAQQKALVKVRKMISVGKRLGVEIQGNEEEVQSRLLQVEEWEEGIGGIVEEEGGGCGIHGYDWVMMESLGASGGLLCIWDKVKFVKLGVVIGDGFLAIEGEELGKMVMEKGRCWLIAGDFNVVRYPKERRGRTEECPEMEDFNAFIETTRLIDIRLANRRFTWYRPDGSSMSRLDRFLMMKGIYEMGHEWVQKGMQKTVLDHCAVILHTTSADWGLKPFRVLDAWPPHPNFRTVVDTKWREMVVKGYIGYRCQQKLRLLKEFIKGWNREVFGNVDAQFEKATNMAEQLDIKNEDFDLEEFELSQRQEGVQDIWDILRKREAIWRRKSRSNWVKLGDANARFFHKVVNCRRA